MYFSSTACFKQKHLIPIPFIEISILFYLSILLFPTSFSLSFVYLKLTLRRAESCDRCSASASASPAVLQRTTKIGFHFP